jgi:hypothetical protein
MKWLLENSHWIIGFAGIWMLGNGILHDVFILLQKRPFEKELIRLLIDGHILIFSGIFFLICFKSLQEGSDLALWLCIVNALFILGYCALIFKMLPAVGIIVISLVVLVVSVLAKFSPR